MMSTELEDLYGTGTQGTDERGDYSDITSEDGNIFRLYKNKDGQISDLFYPVEGEGISKDKVGSFEQDSDKASAIALNLYNEKFPPPETDATVKPISADASGTGLDIFSKFETEDKKKAQKYDTLKDMGALAGLELLKFTAGRERLVRDPELKRIREEADEEIDEAELRRETEKDMERVAQTAGGAAKVAGEVARSTIAANQGQMSLKQIKNVMSVVTEKATDVKKAGLEFVLERDAMRRAQALAEKQRQKQAALGLRLQETKLITDSLGAIQAGIAPMLGAQGAKYSATLLQSMARAAGTDLSAQQVRDLQLALKNKKTITALDIADAADDLGITLPDGYAEQVILLNK
jgi:hypothetical protein